MKKLACLVVLLASAAPAFGETATLGDAVDLLKDVIRSRLESIGDPVPRELKGEAKSLGKALNALEKWVQADQKGLKSLSKAAKLADMADSADSGVMSALDEAVSSMRAAAEQARQSAQEGKDGLDDPKNAARVGKLIDKYAELLDAATGTDLGTLAKQLVKGILGFEKAVATADKLLAKEMKKGGGGGGLSLDPDGKIGSAGGFTITDIQYNLRVRFGGISQPVKGKLSGGPGWTPIPVPAGAFFDGAALIPIPPLPGELSITGSFTYVTTAGNVTFKFK